MGDEAYLACAGQHAAALPSVILQTSVQSFQAKRRHRLPRSFQFRVCGARCVLSVVCSIISKAEPVASGSTRWVKIRLKSSAVQTRLHGSCTVLVSIEPS